ncbi:MAG: methylase [Edaphobacter sp.]|nr:methylase [Edaphobacter sp.]
MHLNWNEIRARAARFAQEWGDAEYEKGETQSFYNEFFEIFGIRRRRLASYEEPVKLLGERRGFIDLFWKGVLLVEQKSAGRDLVRAKQQALEYFPGLKEHELPRYILVSDFQHFELYDLDEDTRPVKFHLRDLPKHIEAFTFILGVEKRTFRDQDPVNIEASELMGKLHDALKDSGYVGHNLERLLVRVVFCLFADDTGIFEPRDLFHELILNRTREDGSDVGLWLISLFEILNTPEDRRQRALDEDLQAFPYVNGDLFDERLPVPAFDPAMRNLLLEACNFTWDAISPAIFGALFQSVMDDGERRQTGAHYTTEKNILKVIRPLFLDSLWSEFETLRQRRDSGRRQLLIRFHDRLAAMRYFDPACGCGNFLIIAYRELRTLEIQLLKEIFRGEDTLSLDVSTLSRINVDQFYGIEIAEFPARIAEVALWMMDHIMNNRLSLEFGNSYVRIPLRTSPHIRNADALEIGWQEVLPSASCSYVFGNPPFGGSKYQTAHQRGQVRRIAALGGSGGTLDFVTAWFIKTGEYVQGTGAKIGFVATNSVTQGEQVAQLWPVLFGRYGLEISYAHRTFAWGSDARGMAHVHVVIIGLTLRADEPPVKKLYSYADINGEPVESPHTTLTPYLFDGSNLRDRHLVVREASRPLDGTVPPLIIGSKPIDGGHYIFTEEQRVEFLRSEPGANRYLHPYIGATEFLYNERRWILALNDANPSDLRRLPLVLERIENVRDFRLRSRDAGTKALAASPTRYHVTVIPTTPFLVVPEATSETREYVPIAWLRPPVIPSNLVKILQGASLWHFGILTSRIHMSWLRHIGGRLKSDYRYSAGVVYNPFPWPEADEHGRARVANFAQEVLNARAEYTNASLADLYDSNAMPLSLLSAHHALDRAVDRLYRRAAFTSDRERVEYLFGLYEGAIMPRLAPVLPDAPPPRRRARRVMR